MRSQPHTWERWPVGEGAPNDDVMFIHGSIIGYAYGDSIALFHAVRGFCAEVKDLETAQTFAWGMVLLESTYLSDSSEGHEKTDAMVHLSSVQVEAHYRMRAEKERKNKKGTDNAEHEN